MTSKEYLSQARFLDACIKTKLEQIESLHALATSCTSVITDMPRNPNHGGSRMADAVAKIVDLQEELKGDVERLVALKTSIMTAIKSIPNMEYQILLEKRYLCSKPWELIAVELGYSIQHTYRMHDAALEEISLILKLES